MGTAYWQPLQEFLQRMTETGTIDPADLRLMLFTDDPDEMAAHLELHAVKPFKLKDRARPMARRWLGERSVRDR